MDNKELYLKQFQREFYYIFEIIRGNHYLMNDPDGINVILKIIFIRFKSITKKKNIYAWNELANSYNREKIDRIEYIFEQLTNSYNDTYRHDNHYRVNIEKFKNSQAIYTIEELIRFLDNHDAVREVYDRGLLAELFHSIMIKLISFRKNEYYLTDETISQIISAIVRVEDGTQVFDPFVGTGSLLFSSVSNIKNYNIDIMGQDIDPFVLNISSMLFNLMDIPNVNLLLGDSIIDIRNRMEGYKGEFDTIITHIPYNLKSSHSYKTYDDYLTNKYHRDYSINDFRNMNFLIIYNIIHLLSDHGKAYIVVPNNVLFSGGRDKETRKKIIHEDLIETVIEFSDLKSFKGAIKPAIIILNNKKEPYKKNKIHLVSVQDNNIEKVIKTYKTYDETDISRIVSIDTIANRDYNLNFSHYDPIYDEVKLMLGQGSGCFLRDIANIAKPIIRGLYEPKFTEKIPYIKQSNLKRDSDDVYLDLENLDNLDYIEPNDPTKIINNKAIIVSLQGKDLKPTLFDPKRAKFKSIALANGCLALVPKDKNSERININYLYYQLYNPRVIRQVDGYRRGAKVKRITYKDFLSVIISKPEYEKQLQYIRDQEEPLKELEKYKKMYEELYYELEVEKLKAENRIVNMLIHNVGKHISVVGHDIQRIAKVLEQNNLTNFIYDKDAIEKYNSSVHVKNGFFKKKDLVSVGEIYKRTKDRLDLIEKTFTDTQKTVNLNLESTDFVKVNVKELIMNIKRDRELYQPINYNFIVEGDDAYFNINLQSFQEMIHILINNAEEHAFINLKNGNLKFSVKKFKDRVVINYSNNGAKFNMVKEDFILAGKMSKESNGSGLGGAYLNRVVISHNGNFEILETDAGTKFIFTFLIEG